MYRNLNLGVFALICLSFSLGESQAQYRDWDGGNGVWSDVSKWTPSILPGLGDVARVGNLPLVYDDNVEVDFDAVVGALEIYDGMRVSTNGFKLLNATDTLITGSHGRSSELDVDNGVHVARDLTNEARLRLSNGTVKVSRLLQNATNSIIYGGGMIDLSRPSGVAFRNDGTIFTNGAPTLTFNQLDGGLIDLDGAVGDGYLRIRDPTAATVTFNGTQLADSFSGRIDLIAGSILDMNFSNGWSADQSAEINLYGSHWNANQSRLLGGDWTLGGALNFLTDPMSETGTGTSSVEADTIFTDTATVFVEAGNQLLFDNVTIEGGNFAIEEDAGLTFTGNALVQGGNFETFNNLSSDGSVKFNGITVWDGNVSINGIALQNGNAQVAGLTHIDAGVFDMDGGGGTHWNINHFATFEAESIDSTLSNTFDGTLNVTALFSQLKIELTGSFDKWTMNGVLNLDNSLPAGAARRIDGSTMRVTGELNTDGMVRIGANTEFASNGNVSFADPDAELGMEAQSRVEAGAMFLGEGTLRNRTTGEMTLLDGASLDDVGLLNEGLLEVGDSPGLADVDRFENTADGTWLVEIGGFVAGTEHDLLVVSDGPTLLDGVLAVDLIDTGSGLFLPEIGDEFTVLTSFANVSGMFLDAPVSFADGHSYQWEVVYDPHEVTLRLVEIGDVVPEPNSICLFLLAGIGGCCLRCECKARGTA